MTQVDGWDITLNPELFGEFRPILKSFDQMLNTQYVKYDRYSKTFIYDDGSKFHYFNSSLFLEHRLLYILIYLLIFSIIFSNNNLIILCFSLLTDKCNISDIVYNNLIKLFKLS